MRTLMLAGAIVAITSGVGWGGGLPQTFDEAVRRQAEITDEGVRNTDKWIERHHEEDEIKALHDIEDAIIFDSLNKGDD